jgi:hypothetical protein
MSAPPRLKSITKEATPDAPGWWDRILTLLNPFLTDVQSALAKGLTRRENMRGDFNDAILFTTKATLAGTWPITVKHTMNSRPTACWLGDLERADGAAIDNPFSMTWKLNEQNMFALTFQGLDVSTEYRATILYE